MPDSATAGCPHCGAPITGAPPPTPCPCGGLAWRRFPMPPHTDEIRAAMRAALEALPEVTARRLSVDALGDPKAARQWLAGERQLRPDAVRALIVAMDRATERAAA